MNRLLFKNIKTLYGVYEDTPSVRTGRELAFVPEIQEAWLAVEDGRIVDFGEMNDFPGIADWKGLEVVDCTGSILFPSFADSHTHIVYDGNRAGEFTDRINGLSYEQIANKGGGILNSAHRLRAASEDVLFEQAQRRFLEIIRLGTGAVEIKSGYGLDVASEIKMLRVIKRLRELNLIPVKATFLGAHAIPPEFKGNKEGYLQLIVNEMLPAIAEERLADYIDIFCEKGYFTPEDTIRVLEAGTKYGLKGKVHAEQMSHSKGIQTGVRCNAVSVDHLEFCSAEDILFLASSTTIPTILPGAAYFLSLPNPPARDMIAGGLPIAIASDYNPGSSPTGNMKLMMSIACVQYRMTPQEAFNAATINSAFAMNLQEEVGSITRGHRANFVLSSSAGSLDELAYAFGSFHMDKVFVNGHIF